MTTRFKMNPRWVIYNGTPRWYMGWCLFHFCSEELSIRCSKECSKQRPRTVLNDPYYKSQCGARLLFAYGHGALLATWSQFINMYIRSREVNTEKMNHTNLDIKTRSLKWCVYYREGNNQKLSQHMGRFYPIQRGSSSMFMRQNEPAKVQYTDWNRST